MDRTIKVQLYPTQEQAQALTETVVQFTHAYNTVCAYGWNNQEKNGVRLHHGMYYETKASCPALVSDLLIQARVKATETLKSAFTWKRKHEAKYQKRVAKARKQDQPLPVFKPVKCPQSEACAPRYNVHTYTLNWTTQTVRLSTCRGKQSLSFTVPDYCAKYIGHPFATADLISRKGKWYLHVVVSVPELVIPKNETVIGVDLGLHRPAVTSNRHFLGSRHWKEVDRRTFRLRRKLQSNGSKSAKRHLKKLSKKQTLFRRDCDHVLSKLIVHSVPQGATIVLENLTNIREHVQHRKGEGQRKMHSWSFAQVYDFIQYKGQERGIAVERVDPRHTSQTCSLCGHQARNNRRSQSLFLCRKCGYCLNADYSASKNIREKHIASLASVGTSFAGGSSSSGLSSQPLVG